MLQKLKGPDPTSGRESVGLQCDLQRKTAEEEGAQAEDHPSRRRGHCVRAAEQRTD